eukprot:CAMPEP_0194320162 /NCGR_PEP_ID=MMETSP0171-20130528/16528_1 /TAXON_ID=218684 /ORGANISM="Corethron pennatum, Strain L29A3" /LENGTH=425 /DNA_ID=CAMNT_0039077627 /DNA_START=71 /DNA_END=1348 /DNA_ORIENTATION=-
MAAFDDEDPLAAPGTPPSSKSKAESIRALHDLHARDSAIKEKLRNRREEEETEERRNLFSPVLSPMSIKYAAQNSSSRQGDIFTRLYENAQHMADRKTKLREEHAASLEAVAPARPVTPSRLSPGDACTTSTGAAATAMYEKSLAVREAKARRVAEMVQQLTPSFRPKLVTKHTSGAQSVSSGGVAERLYNKDFLDAREERRREAKSVSEVEGCTFSPTIGKRMSAGSDGRPAWERLNSKHSTHSNHSSGSYDGSHSFQPDLSRTRSSRDMVNTGGRPVYERLHQSARKLPQDRNGTEMEENPCDECTFQPKLFTKASSRRKSRPLSLGRMTTPPNAPSDDLVEGDRFINTIKAELNALNVGIDAPPSEYANVEETITFGGETPPPTAEEENRAEHAATLKASAQDPPEKEVLMPQDPNLLVHSS